MAIYRIPIEIDYAPGGPGVNVFHARADNSGDVDQLVDALHDFYTAIVSVYQTGVSLSLGQVLDVETREPWEGNPGGWSTDITASNTWSKLPQGVACTISWKTSQLTRRGSGRTFIGPLNASNLDASGSMLPSSLATVQAAVDGLVTASGNVLGGSLGVWGYQSAKLPGQARDPLSPRVLRDFTRGEAQGKFAMLRRRRD